MSVIAGDTVYGMLTLDAPGAGGLTVSMAVKINGKKPDGQVEQILRDPKARFAQARKSTSEAVRADVARERGRLRCRTA